MTESRNRLSSRLSAPTSQVALPANQALGPSDQPIKVERNLSLTPIASLLPALADAAERVWDIQQRRPHLSKNIRNLWSGSACWRSKRKVTHLRWTPPDNGRRPMLQVRPRWQRIMKGMFPRNDKWKVCFHGYIPYSSIVQHPACSPDSIQTISVPVTNPNTPTK